MKKLLAISFLCIACTGYAQKGDELLVYSMKGNVTVIENNSESKVKIGKVLKPGSTIKTERQAKLTVVCKQGKPLSLTKEGVYPVIRWKDSCSTSQTSVTSKYFQYIWDQLYVRSEEYKKEHPDHDGAIAKNDAPVRGQEELEILTNPRLETLNYTGGIFSLSWSPNIDYTGPYIFMLYSSRTKKPLYADSAAGTGISMERLKKYMRTGNSYYWTVSASKTEIVHGGVINYRLPVTVNQQVRKFKALVNIPEDQAAQYFRIAYLLENEHFLSDAYVYYQKAASAAPGEGFFSDKLDEFKKTFRLP